MTLAMQSGTAQPSVDSLSVIEVPLRRASDQSLQGFGHVVTDLASAQVKIVTWPAPGWRPVEAGTGIQGGTVEGAFDIYWRGDIVYARSHAVDGHYITGWLSDPATASAERSTAAPTRVLAREANYHPDGGQIFYPRNGAAFVILLAPAGDDVRPGDFVAFYCDGSFGVHVDPGVWHQPVYPLANHSVMETRQGAVHACISVDFVDEFAAYLAVPLRRP